MHQSKTGKRNNVISGDMVRPAVLCQSSFMSSVSERSIAMVSRRSHVSYPLIDRLVDKVDFAPWTSTVGLSGSFSQASSEPASPTDSALMPLYTPEERSRRDASPWTIVQGVLAPVQFAVFLISLWLIISYLATGEGLTAATGSIVVKTLVLYAIMITGSIWEREVFGRYLFARSFFWEDVVSIAVLALHTGYLCTLAFGADVRVQLTIALLAYASYVINATQFLLKLRAARLQHGRSLATRAGE